MARPVWDLLNSVSKQNAWVNLHRYLRNLSRSDDRLFCVWSRAYEMAVADNFRYRYENEPVTGSFLVPGA